MMYRLSPGVFGVVFALACGAYLILCYAFGALDAPAPFIP